jgi:2-C-methyl-D-erythritol 4-phosphate cytidylyltransferase
MKKVVIIAAGGFGSRMRSDVPKQFLKLGQLPLIMHTLHKFRTYDPALELRLVLPESETATWEGLCREYNFNLPCALFPGGETRFHSVKNGLHQVGTPSLIAVHDGVRPLVSLGTISRCFQLAETSGTAVPVVAVSDSIRKVHGIDSVSEDRSTLRLVQTPQVFDSNILLDAYNLPYEESFTDDASVVEKAGYKIYLTEGNEENIKITSIKDLLIAEVLLSTMKE